MKTNGMPNSVLYVIQKKEYMPVDDDGDGDVLYEPYGLHLDFLPLASLFTCKL